MITQSGTASKIATPGATVRSAHRATNPYTAPAATGAETEDLAPGHETVAT
jgi:hypothetical protein